MITDRGKLKEFISLLDSPSKVYELFRELNYPDDKIFDLSKRDINEFDLAKDEREKVKNIYTVFSYEKDLNIFFLEVTSISNQFIRYITRVFDDRYGRFLLILTIDFGEIVFIFPEHKKVETGKHKLKITKLILKRDELHDYTDVETIFKIALSEKESSYKDIWSRWKEAFNVEKVTERFFKDYKNAFFAIRKSLDKQGIKRQEVHEYAIQLLNRIMFIYFISKKRWLNSDPKFMRWFWKRYRQEVARGNAKQNTFYQNWLKLIFFEAFNNQFSEKRELPEDVNKVLIAAPFLNGGLFKPNPFFDYLPVDIDDKLCDNIFEFFEKYNFTIKEDMPLDMEVAVDPQMIGYVYESLANVAESVYESDEDLKGNWGIFYTPRVEVDFMARRAIVEYLSKNLPKIPKEKLYELVIDEKGTDQFKEKVEVYFEKEKLWSDLEEALDNLSVVDPACGSGAFLVGVLNVLVELYKVVYKYQKRDLADFRIKKRIVGKSLYGVDVMPWAIHAAELRLWLQLVVESDLTLKDLKQSPLLPNLNMNLRIGDSLVQEIGGINLHLRDSNVSPKMKKKLDALKQEKEKYFNNYPTAKFNTKEQLIAEEASIFEELVNERIVSLEQRIEQTKQRLREFLKIQTDLSGKKIKEPQKKLLRKEEGYREELTKLESDLLRLKEVLPHLSDPEKKPFVWDIDFAEIFGDKGGFDIVIGNPPYVRQKKIAPLNKLKEEITNEDKKEYKEKLISSVKAHFSVVESLDRKSDYYIYFYFSGLSILNPNGTFCFITSNSWLDVDYGKELQEFLLRYAPICAIYDNSAKRSFEHADVNTIIALFGAPEIEERTFEGLSAGGDGKSPMLNSTARFVMFKKPFEEVISAKNLIAIENTKEVRKTLDYRVYPISHADLMEDGWEYPEGYDSSKEGNFKKGEYVGNKWGGKYLRAPDIFFTILEKGGGKLTKLKNISNITTGCYSGINEFFYLNEEIQKKWNIEKECLTDIIKSPQEQKSIRIDNQQIIYKILICREPMNEVKRKAPNLYSYIKWGEKQKTVAKGKVKGGILWPEVPSVKGRRPEWYSIKELKPTRVFMIYGINDRYIHWISTKPMISDRRMHMVYPKEGIDATLLVSILNSTFTSLFIELQGRANLAEGVLDFATLDALNTQIIDIRKLDNDTKFKLKTIFSKISKREIHSIFMECGISPDKPIREQKPNPLPDRKELDDMVFDILGLTKEERQEFYWAICELIKNRLDKAKSLENRD